MDWLTARENLGKCWKPHQNLQARNFNRHYGDDLHYLALTLALALALASVLALAFALALVCHRQYSWHCDESPEV